MDIVLTKRELDTLSAQKSKGRLKDELAKYIGSLGGEWAVSVHFIPSFAERQKTPDFQAHVNKICKCLRNAINREFHGRRSKQKILFIAVVEGLREFETTHLHLVLGNLGTNNKQRVTKKLAYVFAKNRMIDVALKKTPRDRRTPRSICKAKPKNRIRLEALTTGVLLDPAVPTHRSKGMKVKRIRDKGWASYILKEQTSDSLTLELESIQVPEIQTPLT